MNIDEKILQEHSKTFDEFINIAIDKTSCEEGVNIVKVMTAYNYIKNALSTLQFEDDKE